MAVTISEFLAELGFKVNEGQHRAMIGALSSTAAKAMELGVAIEATAGAVVAAVAKMATSLEDLYYRSLRTRASAENIKAFGFAVSQLGGTVEGANASIEALGRFLRTMPGGRSGIEGIFGRGVAASTDPTTVLRNIAPRLRQMLAMPAESGQPGLAQQFMDRLGVDEKTMFALAQRIEDFNRKYHKFVQEAGYDTKQATEMAVSFKRALGSLEMSFGVLYNVVAVRLMPRIQRGIDVMTDSIMHHLPQITNVITWFSDKFLTALELLGRVIYRLGQGLYELIQWFERLDPRIKRVIETFGLLLVAWRLLNLGFLSTPLGIIFTLISALVLLYDDYKTWKEHGKSLIDWDKWEPKIKAAYAGIKWFFETVDGLITRYLGPNGWQYIFDGLFAILVLRITGLTSVVRSLLGLLGIRVGGPLAMAGAGAVGAAVAGGLIMAPTTANPDEPRPGDPNYLHGWTPRGRAPPPNLRSDSGDNLTPTPWQRLGNWFPGATPAPRTTPAPGSSGGTTAPGILERGWNWLRRGFHWPTGSSEFGPVGLLFDAIGRAEGTGRNYADLIGHGRWAPPGTDVTRMTLAQVQALQQQMVGAGAPSGAVGRYQIIHDTLAGLIGQMGLDPNTTMFTPQLQDQMALSLARGRGLDAFRRGALSTQAFAHNLSQEWASFPDPYTGRSYYGQRTGIRAQQEYDMLRRLGPQASSQQQPVLNQQTSIHVSGTSDPRTTAHIVALEQARLNQDLVRNFKPAVT